MIAKCKAVSHGKALLEYAMRDSKMERMIARNLTSGATAAEVFSEFELVNGYNSRCRNKYLRFEIGIAPQDQEKLKPADLKEIAFRFAKKMELDNHQWIAVTHKDTRHMHIHLIANRIGIDGAVYQTDFVSNRSAKAAEEISRELGLTIAKEVKPQREYIGRGESMRRQAAKTELQRLAYTALRESRDPQAFIKNIREKGVRIEPVKNKQGSVYGIRFGYKGEVFKASEIGREFGLHSLYNHYGLKIKGQAGTPFVPQYAQGRSAESHSTPTFLANTTKAVESVIGTVANVAAAGASLIGGLLEPNPTDYDPAADEAMRKALMKKKKKKRGLRM